MTWRRADRVKHDEVVPTQDDSRPAYEPSMRGSYMLNHCRECGQYKYVYCNVDLKDGKGIGYVCGGCVRKWREAQAQVDPSDMNQVRRS